MNQFSSLYSTKAYEATITDAIDFLEYCSDIDPQADRVLEIITKFAEVVRKWTREHTYQAPPLSEDLSFLFNQASSPRPLSEPILSVGGPLVASPQQHSSQGDLLPHHQDQRGIATTALSDPGLLTPPTIPKMPLSDMLAPVPPSIAAVDTRMNGMTPPMAAPGFGDHHRPGLSALDSSPGYPREMEFDFDNLWSNWINHAPPTMAPTVAATISPSSAGLPTHFSPVAVTTSIAPPNTEQHSSFVSTFSMQDTRPHTGLHGNIPLFHSSGYT